MFAYIIDNDSGELIKVRKERTKVIYSELEDGVYEDGKIISYYKSDQIKQDIDRLSKDESMKDVVSMLKEKMPGKKVNKKISTKAE